MKRKLIGYVIRRLSVLREDKSPRSRVKEHGAER